MRHEAHIAPLADRLSAAFEHSITWEDDIWRADPVDVELVHAQARRKFADLLEAVTAQHGASVQARILLFHGQSGAGKTHLIRALRTSAHRGGKAYFGYAQMTPDVANYADYFLRRLIASLEKPYDPDKGGESALARLARHLVGGYASRKPTSYDALAPGEAMILKIEGKDVAAFRDEQGELHVLSAACTHMGCLLGWNANDRTWDCPCHGSRFALSGSVLHGPAVTDLKKPDQS